jgi:hypothetical protein
MLHGADCEITQLAIRIIDDLMRLAATGRCGDHIICAQRKSVRAITQRAGT